MEPGLELQAGAGPGRPDREQDPRRVDAGKQQEHAAGRLIPDLISAIMLARAKINLYLHVVGRRPDGYHLLDSLVVFAETGDAITVAPSNALSLTIDGPFAGNLATDDDNLVLRAARALRDLA